MKKNVLTILLVITVLLLAASCASPDDGTSETTGDMAGTTHSNHLQGGTDKIGGLEEGGANPTDNVSIIETNDAPSLLPDSPSPESTVLPNDSDGLVDDLGTAVSDVIDDALQDRQ